MTVGSAAVFAPLGFGKLRPSADWVWDWAWVTLGPRKGHPSATQGSRKGRFQVRPLFSTKASKGRVGGGLAEGRRQRAAKNRRNRNGKSKTFHGSTRMQRIGIGKQRSLSATTETRLSSGYLSSSSLSSSSSRPPLASRSRRAPSPAAPRCSPATLPSRSITT